MTKLVFSVTFFSSFPKLPFIAVNLNQFLAQEVRPHATPKRFPVRLQQEMYIHLHTVKYLICMKLNILMEEDGIP